MLNHTANSEIYETYPFLEPEFFKLVLVEHPGLKPLLMALDILYKPNEIAKLLDDSIRFGGDPRIVDLRIELSTVSFQYEHIFKYIKMRGKEAADIGAFEDIPLEFLKEFIGYVINSYSKLLEIKEYSEDRDNFSSLFPIFEIAVNGYGIKQDKSLMNRIFIKRWFLIHTSREKEYEDMLAFFTEASDFSMVEVVKIEFESIFNEGPKGSNVFNLIN